VPGRMAVREAHDLLSQTTQQQVWAVIAAAGPLQGLSLAPPPESRGLPCRLGLHTAAQSATAATVAVATTTAAAVADCAATAASNNNSR
jgi:hypothetical protein